MKGGLKILLEFWEEEQQLAQSGREEGARGQETWSAAPPTVRFETKIETKIVSI